ncbi:MAG TPA: sulfotransferase [Balneolaceae bacterium]|nr:sulfotransferase [Balneolaceae bacterium]
MNTYKKNKVFCIGLSRTGTTSLCKALELLGYKSLHFSLGLFINPQVICKDLSFMPRQKLNPYWAWRRKKEIKAINAGFDKNILQNYDAFGDLPIPLFYKELDNKFPGSKFIYTHRNEGKWLKSMKWLYNEGAVLWGHGLIDDEIKYKAYNCYQYDKEKLIEAYRTHDEDVKDYFADRSEDLLSLNIDEERIDFQKLSEFLDEPVPDESFPKSNTRRSVKFSKRAWYIVCRNIPFLGLIHQKVATAIS